METVAARVLLVEDEVPLLEFYQQVLEQDGCQTRCVRTGEEALTQFRIYQPDLVILDLRLAGRVDGFQVLYALRQENTSVRVLILTGQPGEEREVRGLNLGADDYVLKTVSREHLLARVRAQLRRAPIGHAPVVNYGEVSIDLGRGQVQRGDQHLPLGNAERRVLARLLQTPGQAVGFAELMQAGWGIGLPRQHTSDDLRILRSCIYRLRAKIGNQIIRVAPRVGFEIAVPADQATAPKKKSPRAPAKDQP